MNFQEVKNPAGDIVLDLCPCCDAEANYHQWRDTLEPNATWIACSNEECGLATDTSYHEDPEEAKRIVAGKWNKRSGSQVLAADLQGLVNRWQEIIDGMRMACPSPQPFGNRMRAAARQACETCLDELKQKLQKFKQNN